MLNRRTLTALALLLAMAGAEGCHQDPIVLSKPALRILRITLPPARTDEFLQHLRLYADQHDFRMWTRVISSRIGDTNTFELRRRDIWIEGLNPLKDIPLVVPRSPDGKTEAPMEVDNGTFTVIFARGDVEPSEAALDAAIAAFMASVQQVEGLSVSVEALAVSSQAP